MAEKLKDPNLPAGAIVEELDEQVTSIVNWTGRCLLAAIIFSLGFGNAVAKEPISGIWYFVSPIATTAWMSQPSTDEIKIGDDYFHEMVFSDSSDAFARVVLSRRFDFLEYGAEDWAALEFNVTSVNWVHADNELKMGLELNTQDEKVVARFWGKVEKYIGVNGQVSHSLIGARLEEFLFCQGFSVSVRCVPIKYDY